MNSQPLIFEREYAPSREHQIKALKTLMNETVAKDYCNEHDAHRSNDKNENSSHVITKEKF